MRKFLITLLVTTFIIILSGYQSGHDKQQLTETERNNIKGIVKGAIEDDSWLRANDREEVHSILSQYFSGQLLFNLTEDTWGLVKISTDWYNIYKLKKITIKNIIDKDNVLVKAYIKETDVTSDKSCLFTREYLLKKTKNNWRIEKIYLPE